jgi:hypothetical protein
MLTATICRPNSDLILSKLAGNFGFRAHELREIQSLVVDSRQQFLEAWNEFFGIVGA